MKTRLIEYWESLRSSFWFVLLVMALLAVVLAFVLVNLDKRARDTWVETVGWTYTGGPEGARAVLSTIASSVITIAGVVFSITIAALALASLQFGPRLLRNFMRDWGNQCVLGTFTATFIYCLLVLRTVRGVADDDFVPHLSITLGIVLAIVSLLVLIYFIHHASISIQAPYVVATVGRELDHAIARLFPRMMGTGPGEQGRGGPDDLPPDFEQNARPLLSAETGYLKAVDDALLLRVARRRDVLLRLHHHPGEWVVRGNPLADVFPGDCVDGDLTRAVNRAFLLGTQRTLTQDVEFPIHQLVEIALRSLSPAINDPFTAMACVDRLGAALCGLAAMPFPSAFRYDADGRLRVIAEPVTFSALVDVVFGPIWQYGRTSLLVTSRLLETLALIGPHTTSSDDRAALLRHADEIRRGSRESLPEAASQREIAARYEKASRALQALQAPGPREPRKVS